jgi:hypothetical protein
MVSSEIKQLLKREVKQYPVSPSLRRKISSTKFFIPLITEIDKFAKYNYNLTQLKQIARHYKLPVSGTKAQLTLIIYNYLRLSHNAIIIQSRVKGYFTRKALKMHGPALKDRSLCINDSDFLSFTDINDIPWCNFFSFKCNKGFVYGFDIGSLAQLFKNNIKNRKINPIRNPYNRDIIDTDIYANLQTIRKISKLFGMATEVSLMPEQNEIIEEIFDYNQQVVSICQILDGFGNYTNTEWFINMTRTNMINFIRELHDIWGYRAQLSHQIKCSICPPHGNPFIHLRNHNNNNLMSMDEPSIKKAYIKTILNMITSAHDDANKSIGGMYVLTALTIVSPGAAAAMPWLYESVMI